MIKYVIGDATEPQGEDLKFIVHVCNDIGAWGKGFVMALSDRWYDPEIYYRDWFNGNLANAPFELGEVQFVPTELKHFPDGIFVVNMISQHGTRSENNPKPIDYIALEKCLAKVAKVAKKLNASVHMPRIGCGLAGGNWETIESIINNTMSDLSVTVYDLE